MHIKEFSQKKMQRRWAWSENIRETRKNTSVDNYDVQG